MINVMKHVKASGELQSECSVGDPEQRQLKLEVRMALVCASTDDGRPLIGGTNLVSTVGCALQVADHA